MGARLNGTNGTNGLRPPLTGDPGGMWHWVPVGVAVLSLAPLALLVGPLLVLAWRSFSLEQLRVAIGDPMVRQALRLSFVTTSASLILVVLFGSPVAYLLARHRFTGRAVLDALLDLPMILPPAVAGLALLLTFGRRGALGPLLEAMGVHIAFSWTAVVMAQCFVSAPFFIRAARTGFEAVDPQLEHVAATLGTSPAAIFFRVTLPLALPNILAGMVMAWARGLGEFGATIMFAGNFPGRSQTMPLAVYSAMEGDLGAALTLALILLFVSLGALLVFKQVTGGGRSNIHAV
ncbi:MAG: molybdate ABC transporter permease subunit [Candidatus Riflebacteria bacterium]|nr:molybdate ABC transporter permease subunit [Candidatus Riflebacteria bacterium]